MENTEKTLPIPCPDKRWNCAAYADGLCIALGDANFGGRACLFYKSKEQSDAEWVASIQRLIGLGKYEAAAQLIQKGWLNE